MPHEEKKTISKANSAWEKNGYFKSEILHGERLLQQQNSPWRKMATSRAKFSTEKRNYFKNKILHGQKWFFQEQNSP